jgi:inner membrane protein
MDTLTHALSGALLARALTPSRPRAAPRVFGPPVPVWQALVVGTVAATFPDGDAVLKLVSELSYLRGHRGVTHSLLMLPLWALLLGAAAALGFRNRAGFPRYAWLAAAAIAVHIAGDWITQFGTMLLAPMSDTRFGLGSVFIIDLVLSGIIVAGLVGSVVLYRSRVPALIALALLPAYVTLTVVAKNDAISFARGWAHDQGITAVEVDAAPRPASPFNWTVVVFDGSDYHYAHVNVRRAEPLQAAAHDNFIRRYSAPYQPLSQAAWQRVPKYGGTDPALAREVWQRPEFAFFRWFAMFPLVHRVDAAAAETCVWYRDLRFGFPGRTEVPFRYGLCRQGAGTHWLPYALDDDAAGGRTALH